MAIFTLRGHVSRALDFYNKGDVYFAIGKYNKWDETTVHDYDPERDYDVDPPIPANTDPFLEPIAYKKVQSKFMVVPDEENGTLEYRGTKWRIVLPENAADEGARWVYITSIMEYSEMPTDKPYRQVGVYTGLVRAGGVPPELYVLLPEQVEDPGILEILDDRKPVYRDADVKEQIKLVLEF
jgi:hypothetical protein